MADVRLQAFEEWEPTLIAVARSVARRFSMVDWEDVAQELRLWFISEPAVIRYLSDDSEDKVGTKKLMRSLGRQASAYCQTEKAHSLGYQVSDLEFYSTGALRDLLQMVFEYENWICTTANDGQPRAASRPAEGNNLVAALSDVSRALDLCKEADRELLYRLYRDGFTEAEIAEEDGVSEEAVNKRHDRALARLRDVLGGERPAFPEGPGTRRVMSNSAAIAQTGADL